ncbi:uncharacterized protein VSU04_017325 [Chlamydotis macqueenii]
MRLWLLCAFAAALALAAAAGAEHGDSGKGASGGGRRRPHRPCSGCFSVLSEESRSTPWRAGEDDEAQAGRRERARRDGERPPRRPHGVPLPRRVAAGPRRDPGAGDGDPPAHPAVPRRRR